MKLVPSAILYLAGALTLSSCASTELQTAMSVDDVVEHQEALIGSVVSVSGYLRFGDDTRNLWMNRETYEQISNGYVSPTDPVWSRCITLYNIGQNRNALLRRDGKEMIVTGVVQRVTHQAGDIVIGACSDLGLSIQAVR